VSIGKFAVFITFFIALEGTKNFDVFALLHGNVSDGIVENMNSSAII
jgi:hypothetical protein